MNDKAISTRMWWGKFTIPQGQAGRLRIGPSDLVFEHIHNEWRIAYETSQSGEGDSVERVLPVELPVDYSPGTTVTRFGIGKPDDTLILIPALADRSVVVKSELPFYILPQQSVSYYVSTPLWMQIATGDPRMQLMDIPLFRPSDTWFGPSSMEGVLCYASTTHGRLNIEDVLFRPHRAVTVVLLHNRTEKSIFLKNLNLPVPNLSLYESEDGYLWTQPVILELKRDEELSDLSLKQRAPKEAKNPKLIARPRQVIKENIVTKALSHLIS